MTDRTHPDSGRATGQPHIIRYALELGLLWVDGDGRHKVREALDALDALEAQLEAIGAGGVSGPLIGRASLQSPGFDAADMATASAQGFRDGVASLSANAGEPVAEVVRNTTEDAQFAPRSAWPLNNFHDLPLGTKLYAAPPTAQAEGWTKPHRTITYTCPVCAASLERQE